MSQKAKRSSMGFISLLTLILIVLKLTGLVSWSWLWVLSPIWISGLFIVIAFATILITGRIKKVNGKLPICRADRKRRAYRKRYARPLAIQQPSHRMARPI